MSRIVILSGSPSASSHTDRALQHIGHLIRAQGYEIVFLSVRDFSPTAICRGHYDSVEIKALTGKLQEAAGVVIGSPVYKAAYTGVLKALLDLLPEAVLEGTPILPIMVGGSSKHLLAIEYAFKPLLEELKGEPLQGVYLLDRQIDKTSFPAIREEEIRQRIQKQVDRFVKKLYGKKSAAVRSEAK